MVAMFLPDQDEMGNFCNFFSPESLVSIGLIVSQEMIEM